MKTPTEVLTAELRGCCNGYVGAPALAVQCVAALRAAGWIIVREDAIRLAQAHAVDEADKEAEKWRDIAFKRGALLDEIGPKIWEPAAERMAIREAA